LYGVGHPGYGNPAVELALTMKLLGREGKQETDAAIEYLFGDLARKLNSRQSTADTLNKLDILSRPKFRARSTADRVGTYITLAACYELLGEYDRAQEQLEFAHDGAKLLLGADHWQVKWVGLALDEVRRVRKLPPAEQAKVRESIGLMGEAADLAQATNYRDAAIKARQALRLYRAVVQQADSYYALGVLEPLCQYHLFNQDFVNARQECESLLEEAAPELARVRPFVAWMLVRATVRVPLADPTQDKARAEKDKSSAEKVIDVANLVVQSSAPDAKPFPVPNEEAVLRALQARGGAVGAARVAWMTDPQAELAIILSYAALFYLINQDPPSSAALDLVALRTLDTPDRPAAGRLRRLVHTIQVRGQDAPEAEVAALVTAFQAETPRRKRILLPLLEGLAFASADAGQPAAAARLYLVVTKLSDLDSAATPFRASRYQRLSLVYAGQGKWDDAKRIAERGLSLSGPGEGSYPGLLLSLATYENALREFTPAVRHLEDYLRADQDALARRLLVQTEEQQLESVTETSVGLDVYLSAAPRAGEPAARQYEEVLQRKGVVIEYQRLLRRLFATEPALAERWRKAATELAGLHRGLEADELGAPPEMFEQVRVASRQLRELEKDIAGRFAGNPNEPWRRVDVKAVADALPKNAAVVDFVIYRQYTPDGEAGHEETPLCLVAFLVLPENEVKRIDLGSVVEETRSIVGNWRQRIGADLAPGVPASPVGTEAELRGRLRTLVWDKVQQQLPRVDNLIICPVGPLAAFPFAALPGDDPSKYLVERYRISTIPAVRLLPPVASPIEAPERISLVIVGDVDFGKPAPGRRTTFQPLHGSKGEVERVTTLWREVTRAEPATLTGQRATKQALLASLSQARYVLLSTHAFYQFRAGARPGPDPRGEEFDALASLHPRLQTGIALADANQASADGHEAAGILTELEIVNLEMRATDLITLSACQTGTGREVPDEGTVGLARAFHLSGCRTVVASLWPVGDRHTEQLMSEFHRNFWLRGRTKADALRDAQIQLLRNPVYRHHPELWAGWVVSGDGSGTAPWPAGSPGVTPPWIWCVLAVGALGVIAAGIFFARRWAIRRTRTRVEGSPVGEARPISGE
jgi:CHAT domain-containing protein